jgi:hypothetical protein
MRPRQEDLGPARFLAHVVDIGAHAFLRLEHFARDRFVAAQNGFRAAQIDRDVAEFDALDQTVDDLADAVLVLVELAQTLGLAHALDDHLLGGLCGDAAEIDRRQRIGQIIADLGVGVLALGDFERDFGRVVGHRIGDEAISQQLHFAVVAVDMRADIVLDAVFGAAGLLDGLLHRLENLLAVDALLAGHRVGDLEHFDAVIGGRTFHHSSLRRLDGGSSGGGFFGARRGDEFVGKQQLGARDFGERQSCGPFLRFDAHGVALAAAEAAGETLAPLDGEFGLDARFVALEAVRNRRRASAGGRCRGS